MTNITTTPDNMTGAELQTLREACGLTREELGDLADVQARTIKHWENGRSGVPADVATLIDFLDLHVEQLASNIANRPRPLGAVLVRYKNAEDEKRIIISGIQAQLKMSSPKGNTESKNTDSWDFESPMIPFGARCAAIVRARQMLRSRCEDVRIVWMCPEAYEAWHQASGAAEHISSYRMQYLWAVEQLSAQAVPHKADQPPTAQ